MPFWMFSGHNDFETSLNDNKENLKKKNDIYQVKSIYSHINTYYKWLARRRQGDFFFNFKTH